MNPLPPDQRLLINQATRGRLHACALGPLADSSLDLSGARRLGLALAVSGSDLLLMALLNAALRLTASHYLERRQFVREEDRLTIAGRARVLAGLDVVLRETVAEYPLPSSSAAAADVVELFLLDVQLDNVAMHRHRSLYDDQALAARQNWRPFASRLAALLGSRARQGSWGRNLRDLLRDPLRAAPNDLAGQVAFVMAAWAAWLPAELLQQLGVARAIALEEAQPRLGGPGPTRDEGLPDMAGDGPAAFSADRDWMVRAVLLAKSVAVWLNQLSRQYQSDIRTLDQIPDAELDRLAEWGINALWLIGIWERSAASRTIKQLRGNPEAEASAYALHAYRVAAELGGDAALANLEARCAARGVRLACDVVPNHTGIDSEWVLHHPDWFIQSEQPPYPAYRFTGPDLSRDPAVSLRIEDGYWDHRDAAVVFEHVDQRSGRRRYLYHGNDGTHMPWNDTAQLNFLLPEVRRAMSDLIVATARRFRLIRFDAAMTLARKHFRRLWFPPPGGSAGVPSRSAFWMEDADFDRAFPDEFWREVVDRIQAEVPDTLLIAEAFWLMESYFVRTLGMHRVYNSAFMNLLKQEENAKYRRILKGVLAFNPEILKRYVNFMNNPDEATAIEQFGTGDKYFGVAVLLATLPGLPMFGHGQIEGFREKYGMEYRRAYWDETPDQAFIAHHAAQIFPLLRRRRLFAEVADFQLYDLHTGHGVDDNVYAFSNGPAGDRQLVIYNNSPQATAGRLHQAAPKAAAHREGEAAPGTTLARELGIGPGSPELIRFRDQRDGRQSLRSGDRLRQGLHVDLGPYQYQLLHGFERLSDEEGWWARLYASLGDAPVEDLDRELLRLRYRDLWTGWQQLVAPGRLHALAGTLLATPLTAAALALIAELDEELQEMAGRLAAVVAPGEPLPSPPALVDDLRQLATWLPAASGLRGFWDDTSQRAGAGYPLLCWRLFALLTRCLPGSPQSAPLWTQCKGFGLDQAWQELESAGVAAGERQLAMVLLACAGFGPPPALAAAPLGSLLRDPAQAAVAGINHYQGTTWFNRERMTRLIGTLALQAAHQVALTAPGRRQPLLARIAARAGRRLAIAEACGYRLQEFLRQDAAPLPGKVRAVRSDRRLRILMVTSEAAPLAKSGGLGDVLGSLPAALRRRGTDVRVVLPWYRCVAAATKGVHHSSAVLNVPFGDERHQARYHTLELDGVPVYGIELPYLFDRAGLYGEAGVDYADNARRFAIFSRAALELAKKLRFAPDIVHAHDWQAALAPVYLRHRLWADPFFAATGSLLTIHNLGYQGCFPAATLTDIDLDPSLFTIDGLEFHGAISFLKGGIQFADRISTVSPTYAQEIQTPAFGVGLDGLLRSRVDRLHGILNGLDSDSWNPATDPALPSPYAPDALAGKVACKEALQRALGLTVAPETPLAAMVSRLDPQKGLDLLLANWQQLLARPLQLVILGSGHPGYEQRLRELAAHVPGRITVIVGFDESLARRIYAASDLFLMPSAYEPCGLGQLIALRYGSVPLVHATGGLADTVRDPQAHPATANGFIFREYDGESLLASLDRLLRLRRDDPTGWRQLMVRGMTADFSWRRSADDYLTLYRTITEAMA